MKVELETVTPLFLGGADPRGEPELRAASFRGVLRFWWRALIGGSVGDGNLEALREAETAVFGNTKYGSPVILRLSGQSQLQTFSPNQAGVKYLFWSMLRTNRQYLRAGMPFTLTLQTRSGIQSDGPLIRALAALWLLTHLGGIGSRARRGGGSVQVTKVKDPRPPDMPDLQVQAQTPEQLRDELANGLKQLRALLNIGDLTLTPSVTPAFDVLHPNCCRIVVLDKTWHTWEEALDEVGREFQTFRVNCRKLDYQNVKNVVSGNSGNLQPVERAAFGLPIVFYYRSLSGQKGTLEGSIHDRRASPLLIRVVRLANEQHTIVMTFFKAALLEDREGLALKQGRHTLAATSAPNLSLIDAFLSGIGISLLEVKNW